jgi:hypothetical protein
MTMPETNPTGQDPHQGVEMPQPTAWPMVLSVAIVLLVAGIVTNLVLSLVGALLFVVSLTGWVAHLMPGRGHTVEELAPAEQRAKPVEPRPGTVDQMKPGLPGHRFQLPEKIHPISAGIWGGIVGGVAMTIPALLYGLLSGNRIWFPINLLAGMVLPGLDQVDIGMLKEFHLNWFLMALCIHAVLSLGLGLVYGVLLPTLPQKHHGPILWGGVVLPLLWTEASYGLMSAINPALRMHVDWHWFLISQLVFGVVTALVVEHSEQVAIPPIPQQNRVD